MAEQSPESWAVAWHDRGHGHGDYAVITESGTLIAKVEDGPKVEENAYKLAAAPAPALLAACKLVMDSPRGKGLTPEVAMAVYNAVDKAEPYREPEEA